MTDSNNKPKTLEWDVYERFKFEEKRLKWKLGTEEPIFKRYFLSFCKSSTSCPYMKAAKGATVVVGALGVAAAGASYARSRGYDALTWLKPYKDNLLRTIGSTITEEPDLQKAQNNKPR